MTNCLSTFFRFLVAAAISTVLFLPYARCQSPPVDDPATLQGTINDTQNHPLEGAAVSLKNKDTGNALNAVTDSRGHYSFAGISPGTYALRVKRKGWLETSKGPLNFVQGQKTIVDVQLQPDASESNKNSTAPMEFSIEPSFTVPGVTDPTNLGGHGSDAGMRTKESLAKATVSLNGANIKEEKKRVDALRNGPDTAELHELLG